MTEFLSYALYLQNADQNPPENTTATTAAT
jgi:hypothetical protein